LVMHPVSTAKAMVRRAPPGRSSSTPRVPAAFRPEPSSRRKSSPTRLGRGAGFPKEVSGESCRTPLMGDLKDCPSVDICCARPLPVLHRPRPNGVPAEAGSCSLLAVVPRDHHARRASRLRGAPSARACQSPSPVPPLPFLTTSAAFSAHAVQVCCTLQPTMGFAWFPASLSGPDFTSCRCSRRERCGHLQAVSSPEEPIDCKQPWVRRCPEERHLFRGDVTERRCRLLPSSEQPKLIG
jgi:hypothetical protein